MLVLNKGIVSANNVTVVSGVLCGPLVVDLTSH